MVLGRRGGVLSGDCNVLKVGHFLQHGCWLPKLNLKPPKEGVGSEI